MKTELSRNYGSVVLRSTLLAALMLGGGVFANVDENIEREVVQENATGFYSNDGIVDLTLDFNRNWRFNLGDVPNFFTYSYPDQDWRRAHLAGFCRRVSAAIARPL